MSHWNRNVVATILFFAIGLFLSFILGYYTALYFQNQLQIFGLIGSIVSLISVVVVILKLIIDWHNQPTLEFNGIYKPKQEYLVSSTNGKTFYQSEYFVIVKNKKGRGKAEECEGLLEVKETDIKQYTVWKNNCRYVSIGIEDYLKLFDIREYDDNHQKEIIFYSNLNNSKEIKPSPRIEIYTPDISNKRLSIALQGGKGKSKEFIKTIGEIEQTK